MILLNYCSFATKPQSWQYYIVGVKLFYGVQFHCFNSYISIFNLYTRSWIFIVLAHLNNRESSSYGSWIYNYLCNKCLSPITLWVRIPFRGGVLDTTLHDKACQWLAAGPWFLQVLPVSFSNKTDRNEEQRIISSESGSCVRLERQVFPRTVV
jgi:hypothetical protein